MKKQVAIVASLFALASCQSANLIAYRADGQEVKMTFYNGNSSGKVPDLLIIEGKNYFGKAGYQMDDPLGDISFRFEDGKKIQAECAEVGKNSIDKPECKSYRIYRSDLDLLPVDTIVPRPNGLI